MSSHLERAICLSALFFVGYWAIVMPKIVAPDPQVALERYYKSVEIVISTNATIDKAKRTDNAITSGVNDEKEEEVEDGKEEEEKVKVKKEEVHDEEKKEEEEEKPVARIRRNAFLLVAGWEVVKKWVSQKQNNVPPPQYGPHHPYYPPYPYYPQFNQFNPHNPHNPYPPPPTSALLAAALGFGLFIAILLIIVYACRRHGTGGGILPVTAGGGESIDRVTVRHTPGLDCLLHL